MPNTDQLRLIQSYCVFASSHQSVVTTHGYHAATSGGMALQHKLLAHQAISQNMISLHP